jgi:AcrR family transcriptional regulator
VVVGQQEVHAAHNTDVPFKYRTTVRSCYGCGMPAPPTRPVLRQRWDRRADELVEAAAARFARTGYDETSMAELAAELGIAAGGVYHYFGGKEALLRRICLELTEPLHPRALDALDGLDDPADQLRALVDVWVQHVVEHRDHMLVFQQERHVIEAPSGATSARAASASRSSSTACSPSSRTTRGPGSPTGGSRSPPCWAW